jgi:hypothetical protein
MNSIKNIPALIVISVNGVLMHDAIYAKAGFLSHRQKRNHQEQNV